VRISVTFLADCQSTVKCSVPIVSGTSIATLTGLPSVALADGDVMADFLTNLVEYVTVQNPIPSGEKVIVIKNVVI
jgi:hypothetical protein